MKEGEEEGDKVHSSSPSTHKGGSHRLTGRENYFSHRKAKRTHKQERGRAERREKAREFLIRYGKEVPLPPSSWCCFIS